MSKRSKIAVIIILVLMIAGLIAYAVVGELSRRYVIKKHLMSVIITVEDDNITLKDAAYYIIDVEKTIDGMAREYNPDDPKDFWKTHFKNSFDSVFTTDYAKKLVRELCIYDYIMEREAIKKGVSLTEYEIECAKQDSASFYNNLSDYVIKKLDINRDNMDETFERRALVKKYVENVAEELEKQGYSEEEISQLNYDGVLYQNTIKMQYNTSYSEKEFNKLPIGFITINYE